MKMDWELLVGLGGFIFAALSYFSQRKVKAFSYSILETEIVSVKERIKDVVVTYKDKPVKSLRLAVIKVWNSGNDVIKVADYADVPIYFCEKYRAGSLVVGQIEEAPKFSKAELYDYRASFREVWIALKPMLLNPGDSVTIKIVLAEYEGERIPVNVNGRISGVRSFKNETYSTTKLNPVLGFLVKSKILVPKE